MKCQYCDGTGEHINDANRMTTCEFCNGKGVIEPLTNEEWFCFLSTEEKAKWLEDKMMWAAQEQGTFTSKGWEKWLKEKHHDSVQG